MGGRAGGARVRCPRAGNCDRSSGEGEAEGDAGGEGVPEPKPRCAVTCGGSPITGDHFKE